MRKRREDRPQTAREMRAELRMVRESMPYPIESRSVLTPTPEPSSPVAVNAATVRAGTPRVGDTTPAPSKGPELRSAGTPSGTMALPELPVERSRWVTVAFLVGLVGLLGGGVMLTFFPGLVPGVGTRSDGSEIAGREAAASSGPVSTAPVTRTAPRRPSSRRRPASSRPRPRSPTAPLPRSRRGSLPRPRPPRSRWSIPG